MPIRKLKEGDKGWQPAPCFSREHAPPQHIVIPPGDTWEHECPACGKKLGVGV